MRENGGDGDNGEPKRSVAGEVLSLIEDQVELATLEWSYEKKQSVRRLGAFALAAVLGITAFALVQIALVLGLQALGMSLWAASLSLAAIYSLAAGLIVTNFGRRDQRVGEPFEASRAQMRKNLQWIHQFFS